MTGNIRYGVGEMQGWRLNMVSQLNTNSLWQEDAHISTTNFSSGQHLFGVFDGHGGQEVAKFTKSRYEQILKS